MDYSTLGLSPKEIGDIGGQQIQRQKNVIDMLGKALVHKVTSARQVSDADRNEALNRLTETQIYQNQPVEMDVEGRKFQTTRGHMVEAMSKFREMQKTEADTERTEYENQPMDVMIGGRPFAIRRHELVDISKMLAEQERLGLETKTSTRAEKEQQWRSEGIDELADPNKPVTAQTAAKLGDLGAWLRDRRTSGTSEDPLKERKFRQELRSAWNGINVEMNKKPSGKSKEPLALANSANAIAEDLGEPIATVVFSENFVIPGWTDNIRSGYYKMDDIRNPSTGERITIKELREQAEADGMNLNDALKILYILQHKAKEEME